MSVVVKRTNPNALAKVIQRMKRADGLELAVGIPIGSTGASANYPDGTPILKVAAANNFGATINHPGGTQFVISDGKARFVSNDFVGPVAGVTKPHTIKIPERPFLTMAAEPMIEATIPIAERLIPKLNEGKASAADILEKMGPFAVSAMQETIENIKNPPNAPSTVRKKGSNNPLEDTGLLVQSITHGVRSSR